MKVDKDLTEAIERSIDAMMDTPLTYMRYGSSGLSPVPVAAIMALMEAAKCRLDRQFELFAKCEGHPCRVIVRDTYKGEFQWFIFARVGGSGQ